MMNEYKLTPYSITAILETADNWNSPDVIKAIWRKGLHGKGKTATCTGNKFTEFASAVCNSTKLSPFEKRVALDWVAFEVRQNGFAAGLEYHRRKKDSQ